MEDAQRIYLTAGLIALEERDLDEALSWTEEGYSRFPDKRGFAGLLLLILAGKSEHTESMIEQGWEAVRLLEGAEGPEKWPAHRLKMAVVLAATGLSDSARSVIGRAREETTDDPWVHYYEAKARLNLGEQQEAIQLLAQLLDAIPGFRAYLADDWWFDSLHADSTFQALVSPKD